MTDNLFDDVDFADLPKIVICSNCSAPVSSNAAVCPRCGLHPNDSTARRSSRMPRSSLRNSSKLEGYFDRLASAAISQVTDWRLWATLVFMIVAMLGTTLFANSIAFTEDAPSASKGLLMLGSAFTAICLLPVFAACGYPEAYRMLASILRWLKYIVLASLAGGAEGAYSSYAEDEQKVRKQSASDSRRLSVLAALFTSVGMGQLCVSLLLGGVEFFGVPSKPQADIESASLPSTPHGNPTTPQSVLSIESNLATSSSPVPVQEDAIAADSTARGYSPRGAVVSTEPVRPAMNQPPTLSLGLPPTRELPSGGVLRIDVRLFDPEGHDGIVEFQTNGDLPWKQAIDDRIEVADLPLGPLTIAVRAIDQDGATSDIVTEAFEVVPNVWHQWQESKEFALDRFTMQYNSLAGIRLLRRTPSVMILRGSAEGSAIALVDGAGEPIKRPTGYTLCDSSLAILPDGNLLATCRPRQEDAHLISLHSSRYGRLLRNLEGKTKRVGSVVFSPDGAQLLSHGDEGRLELFDVRSGQLLLTLDPSPPELHDLTFSPDGSLIAGRCGPGSILLWRVTDGVMMSEMNGNGTHLTRASIKFHPEGHQLISITQWRVQVWSVPEAKLLYDWSTDGEESFATALTPGAQFIAIAGKNGVRIWSVLSGALVHQFDCPQCLYGGLVFNREGTALAAANNQTIYTWTGPDAEKHSQEVFRTWTSADGNYRTRAALVRYEQGEVTLRKEDKTEVTLPATGLSQEDQLFLQSP